MHRIKGTAVISESQHPALTLADDADGKMVFFLVRTEPVLDNIPCHLLNAQRNMIADFCALTMLKAKRFRLLHHPRHFLHGGNSGFHQAVSPDTKITVQHQACILFPRHGTGLPSNIDTNGNQRQQFTQAKVQPHTVCSHECTANKGRKNRKQGAFHH